MIALMIELLNNIAASNQVYSAEIVTTACFDSYSKLMGWGNFGYFNESKNGTSQTGESLL
ncbi:MAG: hypothetical protein J7464_11090 [Chloroflexus sp.]|jgi:hypothetical protein|nr:hypothetical protein [Chloroflexus sp.]